MTGFLLADVKQIACVDVGSRFPTNIKLHCRSDIEGEPSFTMEVAEAMAKYFIDFFQISFPFEKIGNFGGFGRKRYLIFHRTVHNITFSTHCETFFFFKFSRIWDWFTFLILDLVVLPDLPVPVLEHFSYALFKEKIGLFKVTEGSTEEMSEAATAIAGAFCRQWFESIGNFAYNTFDSV